MKKHDKRTVILLLLLAAALVFTACGGNGGVDEPENADPIVRTDQLGLTTVTITDGDAVVTFDPDRWEEFSDETLVYETAEVYLPSAEPFPVNTINGKIKDVIVEQVEAFSFNFMSDFVIPSLMLLMEDGSVELATPNPFVLYPGYDEIDTDRVLPVPESVVALSFEPITEGIGGNTIVAEAESGLHYDLRHVYKYMKLDDGVWVSHTVGSDEDHKLWLWLGEDERASLIKRRPGDESYEIAYQGTYIMHLDEEASRGLKPGMLSVDFALADVQGSALDEEVAEQITGSFFVESSWANGWLDLYHSDGDSLHDVDGVPVDYCAFWRESI